MTLQDFDNMCGNWVENAQRSLQEHPEQAVEIEHRIKGALMGLWMCYISCNPDNAPRV